MAEAERVAARERKEVEDALTSVHELEMSELRERLGTAKRRKTEHLRLLTESLAARGDRGIARSVMLPARVVQLAAPSPDVGQLARVEPAGEPLEVRYALVKPSEYPNVP